jgi:hypothetical protein
MLIEFWESLCGYDKWTPTNATVESSNYVDVKVKSWDNSRDGMERPETTVSQVTSVITWTDEAKKLYRSQYTVTEPSQLFGKYSGDTVPIRYNPANPHDFYLRELREFEMYSMLKKVLLVIVGIAISIYLLLRHMS